MKLFKRKLSVSVCRKRCNFIQIRAGAQLGGRRQAADNLTDFLLESRSEAVIRGRITGNILLCLS